MSDRARRATAALLVVFGVVMAIIQSPNGLFPTHYTSDLLLFGGGGGFPNGLGRSLFAGSAGLGLLIAAAGLAVGAAPRRVGAVIGGAMVLFGLVLVATFRSSGNVLAARPSSSAVLVAVGLALAVGLSGP
ncbi:MAG: hypothetical protein H0W70_12480 [Actinobacteria bacterium]|nr:hypothetical protein [Actinomycetota bacterium]